MTTFGYPPVPETPPLVMFYAGSNGRILIRCPVCDAVVSIDVAPGCMASPILHLPCKGWFQVSKKAQLVPAATITR